MKSGFSKWFVAAAAVTLSLASRVDAACTGDPNGGGLGLADVAIILTCANNPTAPACATACAGKGMLDCADVNLDGQLNISDAVIVLNETSPGCNRNVVPLCVSPGSTLPCGSTLSADIGSNVVLSGCEYFVDGTVFVEPATVVTVRPGATVKGRKVSSDSTPSALIFKQGDCTDGVPFTARLNAPGTPNSPIVFTSDQAVGSRNAGDWGGVAFNGCSAVNSPGGSANAEGLVGVTFGGGASPILNDSSGLARFVRTEFSGRELAPNNELNVWTMNALGSCTKFEYLQAHMGLDDGFEWFGGTVDMKYIVASANADDSFDWQLGTTGRVQYGLIAQYAGNIDTAGSNGIESDNNENGFGFTPVSDPTYCNVTIIGSDGQSNHPAGDFFGLFHRRGTAGELANLIVVNMQDAAVQLRDAATGALACSGSCTVSSVPRTDGVTTCDAPFTLNGAALKLRHSELQAFGNGTADTELCRNKTSSGNTGASCNSCEYTALLTAAGEVSTADPGINFTGEFPSPGVIDPRPTNAGNVASTFDCGTEFGAFFDSTSFRGAFDPAGANWTNTPGGWVSYITQ